MALTGTPDCSLPLCTSVQTIPSKNKEKQFVGNFAIGAVQFLILQRTLCFDADPNGSYLLAYGDPAAAAPRCDYATLFAAQPTAAMITAGPEQTNPSFQPRSDDCPFSERHPALLRVALAAAIALLGAIALRSAKPAAPPPT